MEIWGLIQRYMSKNETLIVSTEEKCMICLCPTGGRVGHWVGIEGMDSISVIIKITHIKYMLNQAKFTFLHPNFYKSASNLYKSAVIIHTRQGQSWKITPILQPSSVAWKWHGPPDLWSSSRELPVFWAR